MKGHPMALFSRLRNAETPANSLDRIARAVLTPAVVVACADGKLERSETDQIVSMCSFNPIFQRIGAQRTGELIQELMRSTDYVTLLKEAVAALDQPLRETAICFAIRVAIADGHLDDMEHKTLVAFAQQFGIGPDDYNRMLDVLVMLQRAPKAA
jgi:tellurite resistance protein